MRRVSRPKRQSRWPSRPREDASLALSVWLRLMKAHGLILREVRHRVPGDLTLPQFDVLAQLQRHEAGLTPSELTRALLVTAGNVTVVVERLVERGLVERRPVPGDRRAVRLKLTALGRARMADALPQHSRELEALLAGLPRPSLLRLRDLLSRLSNALLERRP